MQCSLEQVARVGAELGVVETRQLAPALLTYSPPSHYSTGIPGHITDPFEDSTVGWMILSFLSSCDIKF